MTRVEFDERQNQILLLHEGRAQACHRVKVTDDDDALERALDQLESFDWFQPGVELDFIACWQTHQKGQA
ncbi:MAG TPA: hypothetical protein VFD58_28650 [Blastocatellia bacterium]|nr:hypothetical protein [Blastocatellia bacterium]